MQNWSCMHPCGHSSIKFLWSYDTRAQDLFFPILVNPVFPKHVILSIHAFIRVHFGCSGKFSQHSPMWTTFCEMHLLSFANNFLMLHAQLSNIHISQGALPTYLTTHTYIFANHNHTYIFAKHFCYLSNPTYVFARHFCYLSTPFWMAFLLYVHILFTYMVIHLRGNFMLYIHTYLHSFEKQIHVTHSLERKFLYYLFIFLKGNFMSYIPILRSIFAPYSTYMHTCKALGYLFYIHMYMVNNIFTPSRYKEIIMV